MNGMKKTKNRGYVPPGGSLLKTLSVVVSAAIFGTLMGAFTVIMGVSTFVPVNESIVDLAETPIIDDEFFGSGTVSGPAPLTPSRMLEEFLAADGVLATDPPDSNIVYASILNERYFTLLTEEDVKTLNENYNNYGCDIPFSTFEILVKESSKIREAVARVAPPDSSVAEIVEFYNLWSYIRSFSKTYLDIDTSMRVASAILWNSRKYSLPLGLVVGVAQNESRFKPTAISSVSARGVMQVMWKYHNEVLRNKGILEEKDLHHPEMGVEAGCIVLSQYIRDEKSIIGALGRYYGKLTQGYVGKVFAFWHSYELYVSGIIGDWRAMISAEGKNWEKLTSSRNDLAETLPPPARSEAQKKFVYSPFVDQPMETKAAVENQPGEESDGTTVYNRYGGRITINHNDGRVTAWDEAVPGK